jgi:hypothetical protein
LNGFRALKGFGRIYGAKGMVEFAKSMFKIVVVSADRGDRRCRREFFRSLDFMFMDPTLGRAGYGPAFRGQGHRRGAALHRSAGGRRSVVDPLQLAHRSEDEQAGASRTS